MLSAFRTGRRQPHDAGELGHGANADFGPHPGQHLRGQIEIAGEIGRGSVPIATGTTRLIRT
jgi:hypothetical protein